MPARSPGSTISDSAVTTTACRSRRSDSRTCPATPGCWRRCGPGTGPRTTSAGSARATSAGRCTTSRPWPGSAGPLSTLPGPRSEHGGRPPWTPAGGRNNPTGAGHPTGSTRERACELTIQHSTGGNLADERQRGGHVTGLLEVVVRHPADAERAEAGGADRLTLLAGSEEDPRSPEPALVGQVRRATSRPLRVMLRLREGYGTDGGELVRLQGLATAYRQVGADGLVLGFLNAHTEVDVEVVSALVGNGEVNWTFSRAVDSCISVDRAWRELRRLPGLDAVLTAGSPRGVAEGLDELVARAELGPFARSVIMAGGGLLPEHVPWLARAGIRAFQVGDVVRPLGSTKAYVDPDLVRTWRRLVDAAMRHAPEPA